jgi:hypothetical protein
LNTEQLLNGGGTSHRHWVTLFDHVDDDEFDGDLGENDGDKPMILLDYSIHHNQPDKPKSTNEKIDKKI